MLKVLPVLSISIEHARPDPALDPVGGLTQLTLGRHARLNPKRSSDPARLSSVKCLDV